MRTSTNLPARGALTTKAMHVARQEHKCVREHHAAKTSPLRQDWGGGGSDSKDAIVMRRWPGLPEPEDNGDERPPPLEDAAGDRDRSSSKSRSPEISVRAKRTSSFSDTDRQRRGAIAW